MGSAALFFSLQPQRALLSDINSELIDTYLAVQNHPRAINNRLQRFSVSAESYYELRAQEPCKLNDLDRAARFIFLNRYCFNGLYRTNRDGHFNVPYSPSKTGQLPSLERLMETAAVLRTARIEHKDYTTILRDEVCAGDFVYMDPPYAVSNRRIFRQYGPQEFGIEDLQELAGLLPVLDKRGARFLVSYAYTTEAVRLFDGWNTKRLYTNRNIAGFARHRRRACEILVSNFTSS